MPQHAIKIFLLFLLHWKYGNKINILTNIWLYMLQILLYYMFMFFWES